MPQFTTTLLKQLPLIVGKKIFWTIHT